MITSSTYAVEPSDLDELVAAVQSARGEIQRLRGRLREAESDVELAETLRLADDVRDGVMVRAGAQVVSLAAAEEPVLVVDVRDPAPSPGLHETYRDLALRIGELRSILVHLAVTGSTIGRVPRPGSAGQPRPMGPPEKWDSGDVFAEVYR